jgi:hypothetical protein
MGDGERDGRGEGRMKGESGTVGDRRQCECV